MTASCNHRTTPKPAKEKTSNCQAIPTRSKPPYGTGSQHQKKAPPPVRPGSCPRSTSCLWGICHTPSLNGNLESTLGKQVHCSCMVRCKIYFIDMFNFFFILTLKNITSPNICLHLPLLISGEKVPKRGAGNCKGVA